MHAATSPQLSPAHPGCVQQTRPPTLRSLQPSPPRTSSSSATRATRKTPTASAPTTSSTLALTMQGRFQLVHDPAEADLVLELHYEIASARLASNDGSNTSASSASSSLDPHTHFILWSLTERTKDAALPEEPQQEPRQITIA